VEAFPAVSQHSANLNDTQSALPAIIDNQLVDIKPVNLLAMAPAVDVGSSNHIHWVRARTRGLQTE
jgi:hypothetical protein